MVWDSDTGTYVPEVAVDELAVDRLEVVDDASDTEPAEPERAWYEGLAFEGPLDPAGTLFAFLLAVLATVAVVVIVAGVVRVVGAS